MKLVTWLQGKKTYIVAFGLAALNVAVAFDWIDPDNLAQINAILAALGLGTLRASVKKAEAAPIDTPAEAKG